MSRQPARSRYDAVVDLFPVGRDIPTMAYALVKFTYRIEGQTMTLAEAEPLFHDIRDPDIQPRLLPGSDFWPKKTATDLVVRGSAFAPSGVPVTTMQVSVRVGDRSKAIKIFGERTASWSTNGQPRFTAPEAFTEVPLTYANAYGGVDGRVPISDKPLTEAEIVRVYADHPGLYPRNPFGKGYVVLPEAAQDVSLPLLEDPEDLLTPERLIVGNPENWFLQPIPWCYEFSNPLQFPRFAYLGIDAWFTPPDDDRLPEVRRGYLPPRYRHQFGDEWDPGKNIPLPYFQEAALEMVFNDLNENIPIKITGMHPEEHSIEFFLPPEPSIEITIEGQKEAIKPQISNILIEPSEKKMAIVYIARKTGLPRTFIPGIHGFIPLSVIVSGDVPVKYETPPTIRDQLKAGETDTAETSKET